MINYHSRKLISLFLANFYSSTITLSLAGLIFPKTAYGQLQLSNEYKQNISQTNIKYPSIGSPPLDSNFDSDPLSRDHTR